MGGRIVLILLGVVFLAWGAWDFYSGASYGANRFGMPIRYTPKTMGPFFYFIAAMKLFAGAYAIRLSF